MKRDKLNEWVRVRLIDVFKATRKTIPEFSRETKISERQVQKILRGETASTSVENFVHWVLACGIHPAEFFRHLQPGKLNNESADEKLLQQFQRALMDSRKRKVLEAILASFNEVAP